LVTIDHDYNLRSPSKLVDVGCEVLLDKLPHKVRLGVHLQPLHLGHILEEHIGRYFIVGISSEAVLEVVEVKSKADKPAHGLAGHTCTRLPSLKLTAGRVHSLEKVRGLSKCVSVQVGCTVIHVSHFNSSTFELQLRVRGGITEPHVSMTR